MATNKSLNIGITGFMGTGKSTVSTLVADSLGRQLVDMDQWIEAKAGISIPQIFAEQGEAAFRQMERALCEELAQKQDLVIATGGGALVDETNRQLMLQSAFLVCLKADKETLALRLQADSGRPLAANWPDVLQARQSIYDSLPVQIDTSMKAPGQIAQEILRLWHES